MTLRAAPYGRDTSATTSVHDGHVVSGGVLLAQAALRRVITERGSLQDDLTYGLPIRRWLGGHVNEGSRLACAAQIRSHILLDPRLDWVTVDIAEERSGPAVTWTIDIHGGGGLGTFDLAVLASEVTVELLRLEGTT